MQRVADDDAVAGGASGEAILEGPVHVRSGTRQQRPGTLMETEWAGTRGSLECGAEEQTDEPEEDEGRAGDHDRNPFRRGLRAQTRDPKDAGSGLSLERGRLCIRWAGRPVGRSLRSEGSGTALDAVSREHGAVNALRSAVRASAGNGPGA